jgi:hypothetical protein
LRVSGFNSGVELAIHPEPAGDERTAVVVAVERLGALAPKPASPWGRPDLALEDEAWEDSAPWRPADGHGTRRA